MQAEKTAKSRAKDKTSDSKKKNQQALVDVNYPSPMEPMYISRTLIRQWRNKGGVLPASKETPSAVMWTHMEQNMFELQVAAAEHGTHPQKDVHEDPYPQ